MGLLAVDAFRLWQFLCLRARLHPPLPSGLGAPNPRYEGDRGVLANALVADRPQKVNGGVGPRVLVLPRVVQGIDAQRPRRLLAGAKPDARVLSSVAKTSTVCGLKLL